MSEWVPVKDAAEQLGSDRSVITRWCKKGKLPSRQVKKGARLVYEVHRSAFDPTFKVDSATVTLDTLLATWRQQQANGYHTGKPIGERGIEANDYGMDKFWQYSGLAKSLDSVGVLQLRKALSNVPIDYEAKKCHYSQRNQMFKAVRSFYRFLVREGYKSHVSEDEWKEIIPSRVFDPKKPSLKENQLKDLLTVNSTKRHGRKPFDIEFSQTMILLFAMAGLRRKELMKLEVGHVDLVNRELTVYDGKGHKDRVVGMTPELHHQIQQWLKVRPKVNRKELLLQQKGNPVTASCIRHRLDRLGEKINAEVKPHGLRRTFATIMEAKGMPWSYIQNQLGHSDIKTTQQYVMPDTQAAMAWLKNNGSEAKEAPASKPELTALLEAVNKL